MGLGQGSGSTPSAWLLVSIIVHAYKTKGFGAQFGSAWFGLLFTITAILYIDGTDADLLYSCCDPGFSEIDLVQQVQNASSYCACLLQATGSHHKHPKCFWCLLSYKFICGEARLETLQELSCHHITIPQADHLDIRITLKGHDDPSVILDVFNYHSGDDSA